MSPRDTLPIEKPTRVRRTWRQFLSAPPDQVFPLLCPVREVEWVEGWSPRLVVTESGVAEPDCVFITPDGDAEATWTVTTYDPVEFVVGFVKVTPGQTVVTIEIRLHDGPDFNTAADVSYTWTALSSAGREIVAGKTAEEWEKFMRGWEDALNRYLATGAALR